MKRNFSLPRMFLFIGILAILPSCADTDYSNQSQCDDALPGKGYQYHVLYGVMSYDVNTAVLVEAGISTTYSKKGN